MNIRYILGVAAVAACFSVYAGDTNNEKMFKALDLNSDGFITPSELDSVKKLISNWDSIDADKSGGIQIEEFAALKPAETFVPVEGDEEPIGAAPTR